MRSVCLLDHHSGHSNGLPGRFVLTFTVPRWWIPAFGDAQHFFSSSTNFKMFFNGAQKLNPTKFGYPLILSS